MDFTEQYANFLNQFEKTDPRRFSDPTKQFVLDILEFGQANPDGDKIFAAGMTRLAECCAKFIAARRINEKPVSLRALVLIDTAYAMIDTIKNKMDANGATPAKYKGVVDGCHMLAGMALPGWPKPGTFAEIEKMGMQIDHLPTAFVGRLTDSQFFAFDHLRQTTSVLLSDAAGKDDLPNWIEACQSAYKIKFDGAEALTSRVFAMEAKKTDIAAMQEIVSKPVDSELRQFIEFYLANGKSEQRSAAAQQKISDAVVMGDAAFKIADYKPKLTDMPLPTPTVIVSEQGVAVFWEYVKRNRGRGAA